MISRSKRLSNIDPLELLREYSIGKKEVIKREGSLQFDQTKLELKTPTAWRKNTGQYYTLGDLWLFLQKVEQNMTIKVYFGQRQALGLEGIEKIDEDEILNYFQGRIDTCDKIDQEIRQQLLASKKSKQSEQHPSEPITTKKLKTQTAEGEVKTLEMQQKEQHLNIIQWIRKTEKPINSKTRMLRSKYNTNVNFKQFLKFLDSSPANQTMQQANQPGDSSKSSISYPCLFKDLIDKRQRPIIVVPTMGRAGNISLFNTRKFLEEGAYEDPEKKDIECTERLVTFEKQVKGHPFVFEVYDNVGSFENKTNSTMKSKWERVVAVFVTGQKYQFKGWPREDNIPNILDTVKGFHLKYNETPTPEQVSNWNVKVINVYRHKRHQDKPAHETFWTELENFLILPRSRQRE